MARRLYAVRFIVTGTGEFPFDMLRYDACHPRHEDEARQLGTTYAKGDLPEGKRQIELESRGRPNHWTPTVDRWRSFGWTVDHYSLEAHEHA